MPEPCKFPSLDRCQERFLWTHKEIDLAPHPGVGLVLQVGDAEKFLQAFSFESLDFFFQSQRAGSMFHSHIRCLNFFYVSSACVIQLRLKLPIAVSDGRTGIAG